MKRLNRYLMRTVVSGTLLALLVLGMLDWVFGFLGQLDSAGKAGGLARVFLYSLYTEPRRMYELFPTAVLIGSLLSLGSLAANSELIAMRAAGVSVMGVVRAALRAGVLMMLVAIALGEWVAPAGERMAQALKLEAQAGSSVVAAEQNVWARDGNQYIHIAHVLPGHRLRGITVYEVSGSTLQVAIRAQDARYVDDHWLLEHVSISHINKDGVQTERVPELVRNRLINPNLFGLLGTRPQDMNAMALVRYIAYLKTNQLDSASYELAFWQRFTTPASALIMLMLAVPFVFGSLRSGGSGQRLFMGVVIGVGFYFLNRLSNQIGLVYGLSPLLSAAFPLILFAFISLTALRRVR